MNVVVVACFAAVLALAMSSISASVLPDQLPHQDEFVQLVKSWIQEAKSDMSYSPIPISRSDAIRVMYRFRNTEPQSARFSQIYDLMDRVFDQTFAEVGIACMNANPRMIIGSCGIDQYTYTSKTVLDVRSMIGDHIPERFKSLVEIQPGAQHFIEGSDSIRSNLVWILREYVYNASERILVELSVISNQISLLDLNILWILYQSGLHFNYPLFPVIEDEKLQRHTCSGIYRLAPFVRKNRGAPVLILTELHHFRERTEGAPVLILSDLHHL